MSANIIKSLAVAALLSTTLINGAIACDIDAAELDILVKDTSKGIGQKIQSLKQDIVDEYVIGKGKAEIERFLAIIEDAITNSKTLHSPVEKSVLEATLGEYDNLYTSPVLSPGSDTTDILARLTMRKAPHSIVDLFTDAPGGSAIDPVKAHWDSFLASDPAAQIIKSKAPNKTLGFHSNMKASDFLAQPGDLLEAQARARAATDYYRSDNALPRNIDLVRDLKRQVAAGGSSLSTSDVTAILTGLGLDKVAKRLTAIDGKGQVSEALAKLKAQKEEADNLLSDSTKDVLAIKALIANAKLKI
jgi:hypothetical protein